MVEVTATLDGAASAAFNAALKELATSLGDASASAPQRAAIQICKSFRAGTKVAKSKRPVEIVKIASGQSPMPIWITWDKGKGQPLNPAKRLYKINFPERKWHMMRYYGLTGSVSSAEFAKAKEKEYSRLYTFKERPTGTRGLAKRSWGWVMHNIFKGAAPDTPWQRRKNDRRNPKDATSESYSVAHKGVAMSSGMARICNRLDYIRNALTRSEDEVLDKATSAIVKTLATKRIRQTQSGMSAKEIRAAAEEIKQEFVRQFQ